MKRFAKLAAAGRTLAIFASLALTLFPLANVPLAHAAVGITVDANTKYQTITGLGTNANVHSWNNGELKPAIDTLVSQMGANTFRVIIDRCDMEATNDNSDPNSYNWDYYNTVYSQGKMADLWNTIAYFNTKGATVSLDCMGGVPAWMGGTQINSGQEDEWAEMLASVVYYGRVTKGLDFKLLDPVNEIDWDGIEGPKISSAQYVTLLHKLGTRLDALSLSDIKFIGPSTAQVTQAASNYYPKMATDAYVMGKLAHVGLHDYSGKTGGMDGAIKNSAYPNTDFWMTEYSAWCNGCDTGAPNPGDWPFARTTAQYLYNSFEEGAAGGMLYDGWDGYYEHHGSFGYWGALAYNSADGTYTPRKNLYALAQYYRFIPVGSARVKTTSENSTVQVQAFYDQTSGRITLVGFNTAATSQTLNISLSSLSNVSSLSYYQTNATDNLVQGADVAVNSGLLTVTVPADTEFTLTGTNGPDIISPTVNLTTPTNGATVAGRTLLKATASDNAGIVKLEFLVDGTTVNVDPQAPYEYTWDARNVAAGPHTITAKAYDSAGNSGESTATVTVVSDTSPPSMPINLSAAAGSTQVDLSWQPSSDDFGVSNYLVQRDGVTIGTASSPSFSDTAAAANTAYTYSVSAVDTSDNVGGAATINVTTPSASPLNVDTSASMHQTSASTSITSAPITTTKAGDLLVAFLSSDGPATNASFNSVTGSGLTWTLRQRANTQAGISEIWTAVAPSILSNATFTATRSSGSYMGLMHVVAFSGADTTTLGAAAKASGASGAPSVSLTTTRAGSQVWAVGNDWSGAINRTVGSGQTMVDQYLLAIGDTLWVQRLSNPTASAGSTVTINDTAPTTDQWNLAAIEILPQQPAAPDTTAPTVNITAPAAGSTVSGTVGLNAAASDNVGVSQVEFYVDGSLVGTSTSSPYSTNWNSAAVSNGSHTITAKAYDSAGNAGTSTATTVTVSNDTTPPSVSLTTPTNGATVSSNVTLTATAGDNVGVAGVQFLLDGAALGSEDTAAPYSFVWNSANTTNGQHTLTARARDAAGNTTTSSPITVTVNNTTSALSTDALASTHATTAARTVVSPAFSTTTTNQLLVAFIAADGPAASAQSIGSVTGGNLTWTLRQRANTRAGTAEIWTAPASAKLNNVRITATYGSGSWIGSLTVASFKGASLTASGAAASANGASGAPIVSLTTTRAGSQVWGIGDDWDHAAARTVGSGQTMVDQYLASIGDTFWVQRLNGATSSAGQTATLNDTAPTNDRWNFAAIEILPAP